MLRLSLSSYASRPCSASYTLLGLSGTFNATHNGWRMSFVGVQRLRNTTSASEASLHPAGSASLRPVSAALQRDTKMPDETIKQILMQRDSLSAEEADDQIAEAKEELMKRLESGDDPSDICEEFFGLEPDYLMELL